MLHKHFFFIAAAASAFCIQAQAENQLFNFGPDGMEPIPSWTQAGTAEYSADSGWGWEVLPDVIRRRERNPNPVEDTCVGVSPGGREAVFRVDLDPGLYEVSTGRGDAAHPANTTVFLNDDVLPWADRGILKANKITGFTRTVWVRDGVLRLRIPPREAPGEPFNMVNWLWVQPVDPETVARTPRGQTVQMPTQPVVPGFTWEELQARITPFEHELEKVRRVAVPDAGLLLNFGPANFEAPEGALAVATQAFAPARGWGWLITPELTRVRHQNDDRLLDTMVAVNHEQPVAEFVIVLEPGEYSIEVGMNDPAYTFNAQLFVLEEPEMWIRAGTRRANDPIIRQRRVDLPDGVLRIRVPGNTPFTMFNYLKIER